MITTATSSLAKSLRILLILPEQSSWSSARFLSYHCHLGLEEALQSQGVKVTTLLYPFSIRAQQLLRGQKFDQVWVETMINQFLPQESYEWLMSLAPVRVGLCAESTTYSDEELDAKPEFATMLIRFRKRLPWLTHLMVGDEADVLRWANPKLQTAWWLVSANQRFISQPADFPQQFQARFYGHVYGERRRWLDAPELQDKLAVASHPEPMPFVLSFDFWQLAWRALNKYGIDANAFYSIFLNGCRAFRRNSGARWHNHLRTSSAVVSLPLVFKSFPGRVTEAMSAGRPVLCWRVPERPEMMKVFEDGKEILFYSTPEELCEQIVRLSRDPQLVQTIAQNAHRTLIERHTSEHRAKQILHWVSGGEAPRYHP